MMMSDDSDDDDDDSVLEILEGPPPNAAVAGLAKGATALSKSSKENHKNGPGPLAQAHDQQQQQQDVIELSSDGEDRYHAAAAVAAAGNNNSSSKPAAATATTAMSGRSTRSNPSPSRPAAASASAAGSAAMNQPPIYECSSDDDSDDGGGGAVSNSLLWQQQRKALPAGVTEAMQRARMAQSKLTQAQHYHAHELYVPVTEPELIQRRSTVLGPSSSAATTTTATQRSSGLKAAAMNLGVPLKVLCRTQMDIAGNTTKQTQKIKLTIRNKEPLQSLYDKLFKELLLPPTATLTMTFDGMNLDKSKTPQSYDMENEDLIDCAARATHLLAATTKGRLTTTTSVIPTSMNLKKLSLGKRMKFKCQAEIKLTSKRKPKKAPVPLTSIMELREREPLSALLESMIQAHKIPSSAKVTILFDGEVCSLEKTPTDYGMEADELIDFTVEVAKLWL